MQTLYDLSPEIERVSDQLEEAEHDAEQSAGSLNGHTAETLTSLLHLVDVPDEEKLSNLVRWRESLIAEVDALKAEEAKLRDRRKVRERKADAIKTWIVDFMTVRKLEKVRANVRTLSFRKPSKSVCVDISQIENWPSEFYDRAVKAGAIVPTYEVKVSILKTLEGYDKQVGVREETGESTLVIR